MYSSYRYRPDSVKLNHRGRVLRRKTDYQVPDVEIIDANLMRKYSNVLTKQGYSVYPPGTTPPSPTPEGYIEHDNSTQFTFSTSQGKYTISNLNEFASLMTSICASDNKRYAYKPFGFKFTNAASVTSLIWSTFQFQTGATANNSLYCLAKSNQGSVTSDVVCAWFVYDSQLEKYYLWFAGTEDTSLANIPIIIDDSDSMTNNYELYTISETVHPIFEIPELSTCTIVFGNGTDQSITYLEQPSHSNKLYTSDKLDDPSLIV